MKQLEKKIESKVKIRFPDCDPFNHLNNSKYIDYMINAREDQLLMYYDFDIYKLAFEKGLSWVVAQNQIAYLAPAVLMETVVIETQLIHYEDKSLVFEACMWNESKTSVKALLWSKLVHFNLKTKKSESHSAELMTLFGQIDNSLNETVSFEERVKRLKHARVS
ncbi:MAG: acyl-CoA thioesterase [Bacteroidota bacterium]